MERRFGGGNESNELIGQKLVHALAEGLKVIVCIGNNTRRWTVDHRWDDVIFRQCQALANVISDWTNLVLAYEPYSNSSTADVVEQPEQVQAVHAAVRQWIADFVSPATSASVRVIYGGNVTKSNCKLLALQPDIDGFLIDWNSATIGEDLVAIVNAKL